MTSNRKTALILGQGYTARALQDYARETDLPYDVVTTSRHKDGAIRFDLGDPATWNNIPYANYTFWTFPAQPASQVKLFLENSLDKLGIITVIGSTGAFSISTPNQKITEASDLNYELPRVQGEQEILKHGGRIVYSAGIYGPQRSPLNWIREGRVQPSDHTVNFIHVEDLAQILWRAALVGKSSASYLAAAPCVYTWRELFTHWYGLYPEVKNHPAQAPSKISKVIDAGETFKQLNVKLQHPDVVLTVKAMQREGQVKG